jgi:hydroxymethylglutaryl-CoA lyase
MSDKINLIECPRDAMQGWAAMIPTEKKIEYLNQLLQVGFDTLDFGSFVSPKAIPQMADTREVLFELNTDTSETQLLAIVANKRGALDAASFSKIDFLGFPFSVSPTFQMKNTNSTIEDSFELLKEINDISKDNNKQLVVYLSMGFGNPYGDLFSEQLVIDWGQKIADLGVGIISIADTVGMATPNQVSSISAGLIKAVPQAEIGVHLHSTPQGWKEKLAAAYGAGVRRFDGALKGIGGCPMSGNELVGNMNTEWMIDYFEELGSLKPLNKSALAQSLNLANQIFI